MQFLFHLGPEIFLAVASMLLLIAGAFSAEKAESFIYKTSLLVLLLTGTLLFAKYAPYSDPQEMFVNDLFGLYLKMLVLGCAFLVLVISGGYFQSGNKDIFPFEYPILILLSVVGMMVMVSANNFMSLYMGLELQSLALYVLTAMRRGNEKSSEAGLKYFMLGALSSGILLYGCSMIYGFAGSLEFYNAAMLISSQSEISMGIIFGMVLIFVGLCFKISAVPFHMWAPDVYQGAPKSVTAFLATAPKVAAVALFVRVAIVPFGSAIEQWQQIIIFVSMASMLVGGFGALRQTNIKRLLAFSSIGHMGFLLVGLAAGTVAGIQSVLIYIALYAIMAIGAFACVILMKRRGEDVEEIADLSGIGKEYPLYAAILCIIMFSMAGIPPLAGFFGKLYVFKAAIEEELYTLAIVGVLSSVVAAYYYIKIVKVMYFDKLRETLDIAMSLEMKLVLAGVGAFNLLFFISPTMLIDTAKAAAESLF